jgi:starvation-inducible DNA-binding protein
VIRTLRADLATVMDKHGDAGTSDYLTGLMEKHEKMAWMLRAFLEGAKS